MPASNPALDLDGWPSRDTAAPAGQGGRGMLSWGLQFLQWFTHEEEIASSNNNITGRKFPVSGRHLKLTNNVQAEGNS